ncbi:MAG: very short patch repair endonuclease [Thermoanaerobaculia bacterium]|nr:very short patch repair endonuclease [Thermoanaerobaculia bacterium]
MRRADPPRTPSYKGLRPSSKRASSIARSASRKTDSRCEVKLRSLLWRAGARFRKNVTALPGVPDIVFPKARVAIFCDGDFWHGRDWDARRQKLERGSNAEYWIAKIERNMERDREHTAQLVALGWTVIRAWESDIQRGPEPVVETILEVIGS